MMPNYLCFDGVTLAGPGDCIQNAAGQCYWEIITCPATSGYLRINEVSFCMDECSQYSIETEIDPGFGSINVIPADSNFDNMNSYIDRYVGVNLGHEVSCVECSAFVIYQINLSNNCQYPVDCFQNPCLVENCPAFPNSECVANYCGGCYADFYDLDNNLVDCYNDNDCTDVGNVQFGMCDMYLGIALVDGECDYVSGCGWVIDGIDYSNAFYNSLHILRMNYKRHYYNQYHQSPIHNQIHNHTHHLQVQFLNTYHTFQIGHYLHLYNHYHCNNQLNYYLNHKSQHNNHHNNWQHIQN
jgi:hypothetical protein